MSSNIYAPTDPRYLGHEAYLDLVSHDYRDAAIDEKPNIRDSLLEGYVLWFRNSTAPEELATRLATNLGDHRDVILDAYKTVKRERRSDDTRFEILNQPLSPAEVLEDALLEKRHERAMRREAIGNSARKALAVPRPFERSRRDILMNR